MSSTCRAVLAGLTGIGAGRGPESGDSPVYRPMPGSHAAAYHEHPRTELVAVCDLRQEAIEEFLARWGDVWPEVRTYTDFADMMAREEADLVSIATSDHAHADLCVQAAEAGARAILCEKPIATTLADADRMIAACEAHGVPLSVEHTRRWDPLHLAVRRILRSGDLGPVRTLSLELFSRRAMLFRNGTHLIDLIPFFAEREVQWLVADLEDGFDDYTEYAGDGGRDPDLEPCASAYLRCAGGVRVFVNIYKTDFPGSQATINCEEGRIEVSDRGGRVVRGTSHFDWTASDIQVASFRYERQLAAVHELIEKLENPETELVSSAREARKTLEIILAMLSSHTGGNRRVELPLPS